jgi:hypothetical protein
MRSDFDIRTFLSSGNTPPFVKINRNARRPVGVTDNDPVMDSSPEEPRTESSLTAHAVVMQFFRKKRKVSRSIFSVVSVKTMLLLESTSTAPFMLAALIKPFVTITGVSVRFDKFTARSITVIRLITGPASSAEGRSIDQTQMDNAAHPTTFRNVLVRKRFLQILIQARYFLFIEISHEIKKSHWASGKVKSIAPWVGHRFHDDASGNLVEVMLAGNLDIQTDTGYGAHIGVQFKPCAKRDTSVALAV